MATTSAEYMRNWRLKNPERSKANAERTYQKNKDRVLTRSKVRYQENKEELKKQFKIRRIEQYGISVKQFEEMFAKQDGKCAICADSFTGTPCIDHNHNTGVVRQLLCRSCNTCLGSIKENIKILNSMIDYINRHA
jgi:hypothetical protein